MTAKHAFSYASILFMLASFIPALLGQDADDSAKGKETTITGCLSKGAAASQYALKDEAGTEVIVTGPSELDQHAANHTVKLTGTKTTEGGKSVFKVSKVEMVSPSCKPPAGNPN